MAVHLPRLHVGKLPQPFAPWQRQTFTRIAPLWLTGRGMRLLGQRRHPWCTGCMCKALGAIQAAAADGGAGMRCVDRGVGTRLCECSRMSLTCKLRCDNFAHCNHLDELGSKESSIPECPDLKRRKRNSNTSRVTLLFILQCL